MFNLGGLFMHHELEDFTVGMIVTTPSGRRAVVKKLLSGASKRDAFARIICQYEGGGPKDLVTLQPHQLRIAPVPVVSQRVAPQQLGFAFA